MSTGPIGYADDLSILDTEDLWRNIPPFHIVLDKNTGAKRISKAAFEDHPNGSPMSVTLGSEVINAGRQPTDVLANLSGFCLASVKAFVVRSLGQGIVRKPLPFEPAHAEVFGKKTDSIRKNMATQATWIIGPPQ